MSAEVTSKCNRRNSTVEQSLKNRTSMAPGDSKFLKFSVFTIKISTLKSSFVCKEAVISIKI